MPVLDYEVRNFADFFSPDERVRARIAKGLLEDWTLRGVAVFENMPYDDWLRETVSEYAARYHDLPDEVRRRYEREEYNAKGGHEIGCELHKDGKYYGRRRFNTWLREQPLDMPFDPNYFAQPGDPSPDDVLSGYSYVMDYFLAMADEGQAVILRALATALGKPPDLFRAPMARGMIDIRSNRYIPGENSDIVFDPHYDSSAFTSITGQKGGFEYRLRKGDAFTEVRCAPQHTIAFPGLLLWWASAGMFKTPFHRLRMTAAHRAEGYRESINIFFGGGDRKEHPMPILFPDRMKVMPTSFDQYYNKPPKPVAVKIWEDFTETDMEGIRKRAA